MIRVAIVTDSPVLRAGLASVLGSDPDVQILAAADAVAGADVVVAVGRDGVGDMDESSHRRPTMVLLDRVRIEVARDAYASGASAVLSIDAGDEELVAAVRAIAAGLVVMQSAVSSELIAALPSLSMDATSESASPVSLTPREREVLALLAQGLANKVIAARLAITEHTVKTHVAAVYEKLNARNRAEAVVAAARQGFITL